LSVHAPFLKTPNFALQPSDIPYDAKSFRPRSDTCRITRQRFIEQGGSFIVGDLDIALGNPPENLPPAIILDFLYGTSVLHLWGCESFKNLLRDYSQDSYQGLAPIDRNTGDSQSFKGGLSSGSDNNSENPLSPELGPDGFDLILQVPPMVGGPSIKQVEAERVEEEEEIELHAQEAGRHKVQMWLTQ
jgi:hypothetical protein